MKKNFERGLTQYSHGSLFSVRKLPKEYRDDISKLFSFLVVSNSYSNLSPSNTENLKHIIRRWQGIKRDDTFAFSTPSDDSINERIISTISYLVHRYDVDPKDVDDYLRSLALVIRKKQIYNTQDLVKYLHYSAEAPALIAAKILKLPNALSHHAKMYARAIKILNILLSISSNDLELVLLPKAELKKFGLESLEEKVVREKETEFNEFVQLQLKRYWAWQDEAKKGDIFLPKKLKPAVRQLRTKYDLMAKMIEKDPYCLYGKPLKKPSHLSLILHSKLRRK